ncbi:MULTISPECIES: TRAP transporter large permease [Ruegeria]|uniref:TRAP transporter large permease n=1 Tax=Ruegeria TaxID=97050 RepID=UPI00147D24E9|nr:MULTISPECIES: TRAP transporter large permease [Ruegeria]
MNEVILVLTILFPLLLILGLPIYVSLGITGLTISYLTDAPLVFATQNVLNGLDQFPLLAIPAFILAGNIMEKGGITEDIIGIFRHAFGHIAGSLGLVTIFSCMFFAAISGSGPGTVAAIGAIMIPAMIKYGYPPAYAASVSATGGTLGVMIPPSNPLIIYGIIANVSIADLFAAGMIPGLLTAFLLAGVAYFIARRAGAVMTVDADAPRQSIWKLLWKAKFALFLPFMILGGIYSGIFTPVEASVCAVVYALVVSLVVYRQLTLASLLVAFEGAVKLGGALMIIVACSTLFATVITLEQIPQDVVRTFSGITDSAIIILLIICALLIIIGTFMETISAIIILAPILVPLVKSYGVDPVHFGIILIVTIEIAFLTPPLGVNLFVASQIANIKFERVAIAILPFVFTLMIAMLIVIFIPQLSLWLPETLRSLR